MKHETRTWPAISEIAANVRNGKSTARAMVEKSLDLIDEKLDFDAIISTTRERALKRAAEIDNKAKNGEKIGKLAGVPFIAKDNFLTFGGRTTAASNMLKEFETPYQATAINKLEAEGAICVAKANLDAWAHGSSTENSDFFVTKNPHDKTRVPGGSSGGSAAAVALQMAPFALGTDTGGSVRNPASYCGVVGLKPTYGAVSRSGVIAAASSFDQVGPITKTVEDARILFDAIRGNDSLDATTFFDTQNIPRIAKEPLRIGVLRSLVMKDGIDADMRTSFDATLEKLKDAGHTLVDIDIPLASPALAAYYIINFAEVSANLARYDGMRYGHAASAGGGSASGGRGNTLLDDYINARTEGFGAETRRRILLGTFVLSSGYIDAYYRKADAARAALRREFEKSFESVDVIATPTMPTPAFTIGEKSNPLAMYLEDIFTITANLTGMPALSVPMGSVLRGGKKLPIGIHFTAPHQAENVLFALGAEVY